VERILGVLRWAVAEMDRRYKLLEVFHCRNIDSFNRRVARHPSAANPDARPLPRMVLLIDELADLMMSAPEDTEHNLVRLAQMARAVGIHLVVATQRPGVEVITGLIKANFPARISFTVASSIDSRVILDTGGAETLLGRGDMLFLPPDASGPQRVQGVMVTDAEVEKIIGFWQRTRPPEAAPEPAPWDQMIADQEVAADRDDLVERAIQLVRQEQRCSASMLQRKLRVGFPRAARLVEELEELGVVAPASGGRERDVLLPPEEEPPDDDEI
jgi:S-DNA-T family DNA segregation ATPase FtsK/SpoIIIE